MDPILTAPEPTQGSLGEQRDLSKTQKNGPQAKKQMPMVWFRLLLQLRLAYNLLDVVLLSYFSLLTPSFDSMGFPNPELTDKLSIHTCRYRLLFFVCFSVCPQEFW